MPAASVIESIAVTGFLTVAAIEDIRKKSITRRLIAVAMIGGIIYRLLNFDTSTVGSILSGSAIGVFMILLSYVSRGAVGVGDGAVLIVTGIVLGFERNLGIFLLALVLSALVGLFLLIIVKVDRKKEIPFVPFLLAASVVLSAVFAAESFGWDFI